MTLAEAAAELGFGEDAPARRRLAYLIRQREFEIGKPIMLGGGRGSKRMVTLATLRRHFPELVDDRSNFATMVTSAVDEIREDIAALKLRNSALAAEFRKLKRLVLEDQSSRTGP